MKKLFVLLLTAISFTSFTVHAQVSSFYENTMGAFKIGPAFAHDFPGTNGAGAFAEYSIPLNDRLQGGLGVKHLQTKGYTRTSTIQEYTKATTIDFHILLVPFYTDNAAFRIGPGYSFVFYDARRAYPTYTTHTDGPSADAPVWNNADYKGNSRGFTFTAEYEYYFEGNLSVGARVSFGKSYQGVLMAGPFASVRF